MTKITQALNELKEQYSLWADRATQKAHPSNANLLFRAGRVYVRKMARPGLLCVALVEIDDEFQNQGLLSQFLDWLIETESRFDTLEIECIHNPKLEACLRAKGWMDGPVSNVLAPTLQHRIVASEKVTQ